MGNVLILRSMSASKASVSGVDSHVLESRSLWITASPGSSPKIGLENFRDLGVPAVAIQMVWA